MNSLRSGPKKSLDPVIRPHRSKEGLIAPRKEVRGYG